MKRNPYHVLGDRPESVFDRNRLLKDAIQLLTDKDPKNVSIVGHRYMGKTLFLRTLAEALAGIDSGFVGLASWDLRHLTPTSDVQFLHQLGGHLRDAIRAARADLVGEYLSDLGQVDFDILDMVLDEMKGEQERVLIMMDGCDYLLMQGDITVNLWDNLAELVRKKALRLVTGSRQPLRELCLSEESRTSDFFELFPDTLTTGPLDDADLDGFIAPLPEQGVDVDTPARKELVNWTGGIPILVAAFLHELYSAAASGATVGRDLVNEIGETFEQRYPDILPVIWNDASELQLVLGQLTEGEVAAGDIPAPDRECLCSMGLAIESGNKVKSVCRLMERCSRKRAPRAQHLMQLFGGQEGYDANIRGVLELRLAHIQGMDATLHGYIKGAVRNLIPDPSHALLMVRSIAETALRMVWQSELDDGQLLPQAWIDEWRGIDGGTAKRVCEQADRGDRRLPISPGRQCGLLNLATGSSNDIRRVTRYVTRATYMLLDHVQSAGDYGVHQTERADTALAASICLSAIELGGRLTKELP